MIETSSLSTDIKRWDGKTAADIEQTYQRYAPHHAFLTNLIILLEDNSCEQGASWMLKHYFDSGGKVDAKQAASILDHLQRVACWTSTLHLLQSLTHISIAQDKKEAVEQFLSKHLNHANKFVRAWAYNGFYVLAKQYPEYQDEAMQFFEMAMQDESASVKARIRNVMKKGF